MASIHTKTDEPSIPGITAEELAQFPSEVVTHLTETKCKSPPHVTAAVRRTLNPQGGYTDAQKVLDYQVMSEFSVDVYQVIVNK
ncbi:hypothetical protein BROUX41_003541 [Berkeleyomyces rouxiae]|uniref:uncharacterized protein n=1 Tax=Berkeleyomyces rouxiae TaxID=2035830 RepID=UPI003B7AEE19